MNKMVRKQLFITAEQNRRIKSRAAITGLSEGEVIRRGIDRELDEKPAEPRAIGRMLGVKLSACGRTATTSRSSWPIAASAAANALRGRASCCEAHSDVAAI